MNMTRHIRRIALSGFALGVLSAGFGAAALAQQPKAEITTWGATSSPTEVEVVYRFAGCAVDRDPAIAAQMLDGPIDNGAGDRNVESFAANSSICMRASPTLSFDNGLLAGDVAETLLKRRGKIAGLATALAPKADATHIYARSDMELAGICVAQKAPADIAALLSSTPGSSAESAALGRIVPLVGGCVSHDQVTHFSRPGLRALLAVAAYRIVIPSTGS